MAVLWFIIHSLNYDLRVKNLLNKAFTGIFVYTLNNSTNRDIFE